MAQMARRVGSILGLAGGSIDAFFVYDLHFLSSSLRARDSSCTKCDLCCTRSRVFDTKVRACGTKTQPFDVEVRACGTKTQPFDMEARACGVKAQPSGMTRQICDAIGWGRAFVRRALTAGSPGCSVSLSVTRRSESSASCAHTDLVVLM